MKCNMLTCLLLLSLCFSVAAHSFVPRQQIIEQLKTLRNTISTTPFFGHQYRSYQDSCHSIINEAIARIDNRQADYTTGYQQSLEELIALARQLRFYRRSGKYTLLCAIYSNLVHTFKNEREYLATTR